MKRILILVLIITVVATTVCLSGCLFCDVLFNHYLVRSPKVPSYGAVQSDFCIEPSFVFSLNRTSNTECCIDFAFKDNRYEKDSLQAEIYLGGEKKDEMYATKFDSVVIMAIECDKEGPCESGSGDERRFISIRAPEYLHEEYAAMIAEDTIELQVIRQSKYEFEKFDKQVLLEISYNELYTDAYGIALEKKSGFCDRIVYNSSFTATVSDRLLKEKEGRSIVFVAFGVCANQKTDEPEKLELIPLSFSRVQYKLSANIVEVSI